MKQLIFMGILILGNAISPVQGQANYDTLMRNALVKLSLAESYEQFHRSAENFDRIAGESPENWLPVYYSILAKTLGAYMMEAERALPIADDLEEELKALRDRDSDVSEVLALRGMILTIKVAKEPQTYGMSLSPAIVSDYKEAIRLDPENPRPLYLLAQFGMRSAPYYGKEPRQYCSMLEKARELYRIAPEAGFEPSWGKEKADGLWEKECVK